MPHCREEERYLASKLFSGCDLHQDHEPFKQRQDTSKFIPAAQNAVHFPWIPIVEERANLNYPNALKAGDSIETDNNILGILVFTSNKPQNLNKKTRI